MFGPLRYLYVGSADVAADLAAWTKAGGWKPEGPMVEVPDGPVRLFKDPSGNEIALLEETRPNAFGN